LGGVVVDDRQHENEQDMCRRRRSGYRAQGDGWQSRINDDLKKLTRAR
jgi:hypothetical protein